MSKNGIKISLDCPFKPFTITLVNSVAETNCARFVHHLSEQSWRCQGPLRVPVPISTTVTSGTSPLPAGTSTMVVLVWSAVHAGQAPCGGRAPRPPRPLTAGAAVTTVSTLLRLHADPAELPAPPEPEMAILTLSAGASPSSPWVRADMTAAASSLYYLTRHVERVGVRPPRDPAGGHTLTQGKIRWLAKLNGVN